MSKRTKIMALVGVMLVGAFVVFMGVGGFAANSVSKPVTVNAGIAATLQLTIDSTVDFGAALAPGGTYAAAAAAKVSSNKTWGMTVTAGSLLTQDTFTIPSTNLTYGVTGDAAVKGKQGANTQFVLTSGSSNVCAGCDRGADENLSINYSLTVPWNVEAGPYTATHTYTATN